MRERMQWRRGGKMTRAVRRHRLWRVTYNGENRPVLLENLAAESNNSSSVALAEEDRTILSMTYDRMGRRVTKNVECGVQRAERSCFIYNGADCSLAAHYDYAPFGAVTTQRGEFAATNPWRFSSEYTEDVTATVYYNYRNYEPARGRWLSRDPFGEIKCGRKSKTDVAPLNLYLFCNNRSNGVVDRLGLKWTFNVDTSGEVDVYFEAEGMDRKCCSGIRINRYVRTIPVLGGGTIGDYTDDISYHPGMVEYEQSIGENIAHADGDHPDGPGFLIWRLEWTQSFKWEALCVKGPYAGKVLSTVYREYTTEMHLLWNESEHGKFYIPPRPVYDEKDLSLLIMPLL